MMQASGFSRIEPDGKFIQFNVYRKNTTDLFELP